MCAQATHERPVQHVEDPHASEVAPNALPELDRESPDDEIVDWVTKAYCFKCASDGADRAAVV